MTAWPETSVSRGFLICNSPPAIVEISAEVPPISTLIRGRSALKVKKGARLDAPYQSYIAAAFSPLTLLRYSTHLPTVSTSPNLAWISDTFHATAPGTRSPIAPFTAMVRKPLGQHTIQFGIIDFTHFLGSSWLVQTQRGCVGRSILTGYLTW